MASCFSATHPYYVSWTSSAKFGQSSNLSYVTKSLVFRCRKRTQCALQIHCPLMKARVASSSMDTTDAHIEENSSFSTLRELCEGHVPEHVINRMEEIGYVAPTEVQQQALPVLFAGRDCILQAQTGSGKTLAYLLQIFSVIDTQRFGVQALIVLPTRELGMQAEPPTIVIATLQSLCHMLEKQIFGLGAMQVLVIDEVDFMFNSSKQVDALRRLLTSYSSSSSRQTIFASASVPQHKRFLHDCIQHKWTKGDVVHVHVNPVQPMPSCLHHRFVVCGKRERHSTLLLLLQSDAPQFAIVFVGEQSEKSKKAGNAPPTTILFDFLKTSFLGCSTIILLEEDMNFNQRAASLIDVREGGDFLLVATDIAARGVDLPETTHIYNFDLPRDAVNYLHRAGRTGRKPFSDDKYFVTNIIAPAERFVLQRFENELKFFCEELFL
ncbi:DEAD-box ATP-dependent RNA helicase 58, chloroplastic isoform X4 [Coffea arabica]|uniref:RNA helicase n=1 Tax=Coffea arabica TaxID=13443 RepID=A0ABM4X8P4_COFAR